MEEQANSKGESLMKDANKELNAWFSFSGDKYEKAAQLLEKAGTQFKISKNWIRVAEAFTKAGELYNDKCESAFDGIKCFIEAARALKEVDPHKSVDLFRRACKLCMDENRFSLAGKYYTEVGDFLVNIFEDAQAMESYNDGYKCYLQCSSKLTALGVLQKQAEVQIRTKKYKEAIESYELLASSIPNTLTSRIEDFLYNSQLAKLAMEIDNKVITLDLFDKSIEDYGTMYPSFDTCTKKKLLKDIIKPFNEQKIQEFLEIISKASRIITLSDFSVTVFNSARQQMNENTVKLAEGMPVISQATGDTAALELL